MYLRRRNLHFYQIQDASTKRVQYTPYKHFSHFKYINYSLAFSLYHNEDFFSIGIGIFRLQLFRKLLNHVIYKHIRTRYITGTELQYVIRQPEFRPKVQNLLLSDDGLITKEKQVKTIRHSVFCRVSFLYSFLGRRTPERRRPKTSGSPRPKAHKALKTLAF